MIKLILLFDLLNKSYLRYHLYIERYRFSYQYIKIILTLYTTHQATLRIVFLLVQELRIVWAFTTMRNLWTPININIKLNPQGTTIRHLSHLGCVTNYVSLNWFNLKRRVYTSYTNTFKPKQDTFQDNYYYYYVNTKRLNPPSMP